VHSRGRSARRSEGLVEGLIERLGEARVVGLSGESGSGKTTLGAALAEALGATLVHMDDWYRLPPDENSRARRRDLEIVGPGEVALGALDEHIGGLDGPVVVEGTWVLLLGTPQVQVFLERTWQESHRDRIARGRDPIDDHTPRILAREQQILGFYLDRVDVRVDSAWQLR